MSKPKHSSREIGRALSEQDHHILLHRLQLDRSLLGLRNLALYLFLYFTGLRIGEALSLQIGQVFDDVQVRSRGFLPAERTKGKKHGRKFCLHDSKGLLRQALRDYFLARCKQVAYPQPADPLFLSTRPGNPPAAVDCSVVRRWFAELQGKKGCNFMFPYRLHDLRHTAITRYDQKSGHDLKLTQEMSGHSRIENLLRYTHPDDADHLAVAARL